MASRRGLNLFRTALNVPSARPKPSFCWRRPFSTPSEFNVLEGVAEESHRVRIDGYDETGFTVNGVDVTSAVFCMGGFAAKWSPQSMAEVTPESLAFLEILEPPPELLILGCGSSMQNVSPEIRTFLRSKGIKVEPIATRNAVGTYNLLSEEGRQVAAALLRHGCN